MTVREAREILYRNSTGSEKSLVYGMYELGKFSKKRFWEFYDCVMTLAIDALEYGRDIETAERITKVYQRILKEMIWHFDKKDLSVLKKFPKNYYEYIERLDSAVDAYFRGFFIDESLFELQRPEDQNQ